MGKCSPIWQFFLPSAGGGGEWAKCKLSTSCVRISTKNCSTTGLKSHLRNHHKDKFLDVENLVLKRIFVRNNFKLNGYLSKVFKVLRLGCKNVVVCMHVHTEVKNCSKMLYYW